MGEDRKERSRLRTILDALRRMLGKKPTPPPGDPYAYAMAPLRHGPKGRSGAAVAEIEDDSYGAFLRDGNRALAIPRGRFSQDARPYR
jgi:hypothetical protein